MLSDYVAQFSDCQSSDFGGPGLFHELQRLNEGGQTETLLGWSFEKCVFSVEVLVVDLGVHRGELLLRFHSSEPQLRSLSS